MGTSFVIWNSNKLKNKRRIKVKHIFKLSILIFLISFLIADIKIGYIDSQVIMTQYEDVRQVQVELET